MEPRPEGNLEVVRLTTVIYVGRGRHSGCFQVSKHIRVMRRLSHGDGLLEQAMDAMGAEAMKSIVNLHDCEDGLYKVVVVNPTTHWETPHIVDDYDLKLIPFGPNETQG